MGLLLTGSFVEGAYGLVRNNIIRNVSLAATPSYPVYEAVDASEFVAFEHNDLFDPIGYQEGMKSLLRRGFEVHLLHLLSEDELRPSLDGDLRLTDCEDGASKDVTVDRAAIERYQRNLQAFCREAENFCHKHHVNYLRASTAYPIEELIFRRLRESRFLQ